MTSIERLKESFLALTLTPAIKETAQAVSQSSPLHNKCRAGRNTQLIVLLFLCLYFFSTFILPFTRIPPLLSLILPHLNHTELAFLPYFPPTITFVHLYPFFTDKRRLITTLFTIFIVILLSITCITVNEGFDENHLKK